MTLNADQFTGPEVWRGIKGSSREESEAVAEAHRRGEPGTHTEGMVHVTPSIPLAGGYAQRFQGDRNGLLLRGRLHKDAQPDSLGMVPANHVRWETKSYSLGDAYRVEDERQGYEYPPEHYENI